MKNILQPFPRESLLYIGCGTSQLAMQLHKNWDQSIIDVTHLDFSQIVIEAQRREYDGYTWICGDATSLSEYVQGQYDVILDKALLDTMLCAEGGAAKISKMIKGIYDALNPGGIFVLISYGKDRKQFLQEMQWKNISVERIQKPSKAFLSLPIDEDENYHYIYIAQKPDEE